MAGIEYSKCFGAKFLKRKMLGIKTDPADILAAVSDPYYGKINALVIDLEIPSDVKRFDYVSDYIRDFFSQDPSGDGKEKYMALGAINTNRDIHEDDEKDPWGVPFSLLDALIDRPSIRYLVDGIFSESSLNIIYGAPGSMKSMLAAYLMMCAASGENWLNRPDKPESGFKTFKDGCMWLDFDNGVLRTHERFRALTKAKNIDPTNTPLNYYSMAFPPLNASSSIDIGKLIQRMNKYKIKFLVVDNLGIISGGKDENTSQMQEVIFGLRTLADATGAAVVIIHHSRKTSGFSSASRSGDGIRGHSSIEAGLDLALLVTRDDTESNLIDIKATKVRGAPVKPFSAQFVYEHKQGGHDLDTAWFWGVPVEDTTSDKAIRKTIIDVVDTGDVGDSKPLNQGDVIKQVSSALPEVSSERITKQIKLLITEKMIISTQGAKNSKILTLPESKDGSTD